MGVSEGAKYAILAGYSEAIRKVLASMPEVDRFRTALTAGVAFKDPHFNWTTQDAIFVTAYKAMHAVTHWIFRADPGKFDLRRFLRTKGMQEWRAAQNRGKVHVDDIVYFVGVRERSRHLR